jgi:tetratricopeptide (TPR) repeat protein
MDEIDEDWESNLNFYKNGKLEFEKFLIAKLSEVEVSKTLFQLGLHSNANRELDNPSEEYNKIISNLIKTGIIQELTKVNWKGRWQIREFILVRKDLMNQLLERIEKDENDWHNWINLVNYYYARHRYEECIICYEKIENILGKSFETELRLKDKKQYAWSCIGRARELLHIEVNQLIEQKTENTNYSNLRARAKELYYKASKIYTNFYDEQPKKIMGGGHRKKFIFKSKGSGYGRVVLRFDSNEESNETYDTIYDIPIYYIILRDLARNFGMTYEQLWDDIENKLL